MKKRRVLSHFLFIVSILGLPDKIFSQNVGVGTSTPHTSAALDVQSTNKGMLVPRMALTAANVATPVSSPADALLIYNTATAGAGNNAVIPGFYYWNTTASRWTSISGSVSGNGNAGFGTWGDCSMNNISEYNPKAADDGTAGDGMGTSVSISGNYAITGASGDDIGVNTDAGSAYIFYNNGGNWVQQQKLTPSDGAVNDGFGSGVSISGSYAIVGSPNDNIGANNTQGSAYIFFYNGSTWVQQQKLTAADGATGDYFGYRVSIAGNYAVVTSMQDDIGANAEQGSAYVYFYNGSSWVQQQKLTASDGAADDRFGSSVSVSGNYIIAGAGNDDNGATYDQGSAYIFFYNGSTWIQQQRIVAADGAINDVFGSAVSIAGNYAVVGAYGDNVNGNSFQGSAYIFYYNGSTWVEQQKLTAPDGVALDCLGISVSLSGNYVVLGSYADDVGSNSEQGSAYVFQNTNGIWSYLQKITRPGASTNEYFGISCGVDNNRFVIGAHGVVNGRGMAFFGKIN